MRKVETNMNMAEKGNQLLIVKRTNSLRVKTGMTGAAIKQDRKY